MTSRDPIKATQLPAVAVVVTYRRPQLATQVVKGLIEREGFAPENIILVVNGEGGLADVALQERLDVVKLPDNLGPAGGFNAGIRRFVEGFDQEWVYLCEDDVGLFNLPTPRVQQVLDRLERTQLSSSEKWPAAVVAYGRDLNRRTGITTVHDPAGSSGFVPVDVAPWGASLVSRAVFESGATPDDDWFFGYEDFDFWLKVHEAGFPVLLDVEAARSATETAFGSGRDAAFQGVRPDDETEPWRAYYVARNFLELARRHGHIGWTAWHLAKSVRRWQLGSRQARKATVAGLKDGFLRRMGRNDAYVRTVGEISS
ncbi:MAG: hypothetical protein HKN91_01080 [Acidimicrobiia bacterium]|nr:hypothetical protein [Acidimicrobiia bacterium]